MPLRTRFRVNGGAWRLRCAKALFMRGRPILTAGAMRAAEQAAIDAGATVEQLMERAGAALAETVCRFAGPMPALILCGPGNNGGDGYVAARHLAERGVKVRVAAMSEPKSKAAIWARSQWSGEVETLSDATPAAPLLIDALFGTGLKRGLHTPAINALGQLAYDAQVSVACDLPSGIEADSGAELNVVPHFDMTVTFGALKPAHRLMPALMYTGRVVLADIGVPVEANWREIAEPLLGGIDPRAHKYSRGMVAIVVGQMPGAAALAATAAARAGAGYVWLDANEPVANVPAAVVQGRKGDLSDRRIRAVLVGPGLGRSGGGLFRKAAGWLLRKAVDSGRPLVIDGDALRLVDIEHCKGAVLTPHEGEFEALFGKLPGSKAERAAEAARRSGAVVVYKGPDTIVASPDGQLRFAPPAPAWLATAGTGDVLAGMVAALCCRLNAFQAACAAVWLHGRAAEIAGSSMIADDLVEAIPQALALVE